jgi:hypothetical protein
MKFTHYYAMQSCTSGRTAFATGMYPLRVGLIPPQLPGSPTALLPQTPVDAVLRIAADKQMDVVWHDFHFNQRRLRLVAYLPN